MASKTMYKLGNYSAHREWQVRKRESYLYKNIKRGYQKLGELRKYSNNLVICWLTQPMQVVSGGDSYWAIEATMHTLLNMFKCSHLGVLGNSGDKWLISLPEFEEKKIDRRMLHSKEAEVFILQWAINVALGVTQRGGFEESEKAMRIGKWK